MSRRCLKHWIVILLPVAVTVTANLPDSFRRQCPNPIFLRAKIVGGQVVVEFLCDKKSEGDDQRNMETRPISTSQVR